MKKYNSILLLILLLLPGCQKQGNKEKETITSESANIYSKKGTVSKTINIYKFNKTNDVPYVEADEAMKAFGYSDSSVTFPDDNHVQINNLMNDAHLNFDLINQKATIDDIISFSSRLETSFNKPQVLEEERMWNLKLDEQKSIGLPKKATFTLDYGLYGFKLFKLDNKFYMPLSVFNLLTKSFEISDYYSNYVYNGKDIFPIDTLSSSSTMFNKFYKTGYANAEMSEEMANYNYQTTCMIFDNLYRFDKSGVGEITYQEGFSFFDDYFSTHNLKEDLMSTDQDKFDKAFADFISFSLDDPHTSLTGIRSAYFGSNVSSHRHSGRQGNRNATFMNEYYSYYVAKNNAKNAISNNFAVKGATGIISFDNFVNISPDEFNPYKDSIKSYYYPYDTSLLFHDAFKQFSNDESIKNIVIDISLNTGGSSGTFAQLVQYLYEDPHIFSKNLISGDFEDKVLHADTNFDGEFDELDCYKGKYNFYILTSPVSFSCGNFFPAFCKQTGCAKIIGQKSSGGSCVVYQTALPNGTIFQMSGMEELYYSPDGGTTFISDDNGVEVDYLYGVDNKADFYSPSTLNTFVSNITNGAI